MLFDYIIIDVLTFLTCAFFLVRYAELNHCHPATIYLLFHLYVFTQRAIFVYCGSPTLFEDLPHQFEPVTHAEMARALLMADGGLIAMALACIAATAFGRRSRGPGAPAGATDLPVLSPALVWRVVACTIPIGIVGLLFATPLPGVDLSAAADSLFHRTSWLSMTCTWFGLSMIVLIYIYGFRKIFFLPMLLYLLIMFLMGYHRFRVIIPSILLTQIFLERAGRRWPDLRTAILGLALVVAFFPMKAIGTMYQKGESLSEIASRSGEILETTLSGEHGDMTLMDQFAATMTLVDRMGHFYYGRIYLPLVLLPVPRPLWPDKPGMADHSREFSTPFRPMFEMGMIVTLLGEFYINFGDWGVYVMMFIFGFIMTRTHMLVREAGYFTVRRFSYLLLSSNLLQIYRDGLISIVMFVFVYMMPLVIIVLLHHLRSGRVDRLHGAS